MITINFIKNKHSYEILIDKKTIKSNKTCECAGLPRQQLMLCNLQSRFYREKWFYSHLIRKYTEIIILINEYFKRC